MRSTLFGPCAAGDMVSFGFGSASTLVRDSYGYTVYAAAPVAACSSVFGLVEVDDDWNLGNIPLSRNADVCRSLRVNVTAIQKRCQNLSLTVPDKARDVLGLALRALMPCRSGGEFGREVRHWNQMR